MTERGERREKTKPYMKAAGLLLKMPKLLQVCLGLQNGEGGGGGGGGGAYIGHPMCEITRKPNILANTRDKEVIYQNEVGWH